MRRVFVALAVVGVVLGGYGGAAWVKAGQYATTPPNPVSEHGDTPAAFCAGTAIPTTRPAPMDCVRRAMSRGRCVSPSRNRNKVPGWAISR